MSTPPLPVFAGYGIEIEYVIVDTSSLSVRPIADLLCASNQSEFQNGTIHCSNELPMHQIELKNQLPVADLGMLANAFQEAASQINRLLEPVHAQLMPGGMHPWMAPETETKLWPYQQAEIYEAYDRIFNCRRHGHANVQSMQINMPFADDAEFRRLHEAIRLALPIIPALAASSPFADGHWSGFLDYRLENYRSQQQTIHSTMGDLIPENVASQAEYQVRILQPMYQEIAPHDPEGILQYEWLNTRAAIPRFDRNAIEIRLPDVQECPRVDMAIAAAVIALVRHLYETGQDHPLAETQGLLSILRTCILKAEQAVISDESYLRCLGFPGHSCQAAELWQYLIDILQQESSLLHPWLTELQFILRHGTLARRLLKTVGIGAEMPRLQDAYGKLCKCLDQGRMFE